jgi:hypothetical protein
MLSLPVRARTAAISAWFSLAWVWMRSVRDFARRPTSRRSSSVHDSAKRGAYA